MAGEHQNHEIYNLKTLKLYIFSFSKDIKEGWHFGKSVRKNLEEMGLSYDPNETIKIPKTKDKLKSIQIMGKPFLNNEWDVEDVKEPIILAKGYIVNKLEEDAKAPRVKLFRLPKRQVEWITYLMDKYDTNYKAMVKDKKNYNQETWRQLRAKINKFKSIPEQYGAYLKERGLESKDINDCGYDSD